MIPLPVPVGPFPMRHEAETAGLALENIPPPCPLADELVNVQNLTERQEVTDPELVKKPPPLCPPAVDLD
jgi:hypothetical protein